MNLYELLKSNPECLTLSDIDYKIQNFKPYDWIKEYFEKQEKKKKNV